MQMVTLISIDMGTYSFHVHEQDWGGKVVFRKKVGRKQLTECGVISHRIIDNQAHESVEQQVVLH